MNHVGGASRRSDGRAPTPRAPRVLGRRTRTATLALTSAAALIAGACVPEEPPSPSTVTVTSPSLSLDYGDAIPTLNASYSNGTTPSTPATCTTTATSASAPGLYEVICSGAAGGGKTYTYVDGVITIDQAPLTVTASDTTSTYGDNVPAVTASYTGLKNGETAPATGATCSTDATASSPAGSYTTTCSGADDSNYDITYVDGTATVSPAAATVTASSASTVYGTVASISAVYGGLVNGDTAPATAATCEGQAIDAGVGSHASTCSGAADPNYSFTYVDGVVTVTPAALSITASSHAISAGEALPTITPSYVGLVAGDTEPATLPVCGTDAIDSSTGGVFATTCADVVDPNYDITYVDGTLTIVPGVAPVTVTASSATVEYGDAIPAITATYDGLEGGDTEPETPATCSTTAVAGSPAGVYPTVCADADDDGYIFSYVGGSLTITAAPVTVTASSSTTTYGDAVPAVTATYGGLKNGETAPATPATCATGADESSDAGSYPTLCADAADDNYTFTYVAGIAAIEKASATITAADISHAYGTAAPAVGYDVTLANGQTAPATAPTCSSTSSATSDAGSYVTTCSGADDPNYEFDYVDGEATVTPVALTISANSIVRLGEPLDIVPTYVGLVAGDTETATPAVCTSDAVDSSTPGAWDATCADAADANYTITYEDGKLRIPYRAHGTYRPSAVSTTTTGAVNLSTSNVTINVGGGTSAGFAGWTNLTIVTSAGFLPAFCNGAGATNFTNCTGGPGAVPAGSYVSSAAPVGVDVFTVIPGGGAALEGSSLRVVNDVPAAQRGAASTAVAASGKGVVSYLQSNAPSGSFSLDFGVCNTGTATFDFADDNCHLGEVRYSGGTEVIVGQRVVVSGVGTNTYQPLRLGVGAPATVDANGEFTVTVGVAPAAVPARQSTAIGTATVNHSRQSTFFYPIPAGAEFVSASLSGGDARTSGVAQVLYCTVAGGECNASTTGNYDATTYPYVKVWMPSATNIPGGQTSTMPTLSLTLRATGAAGDDIALKMTQHRAITSVNAPLVGAQTADFIGYPSSGNNTGVTPPKAAPVNLTNVEIQ